MWPPWTYLLTSVNIYRCRYLAYRRCMVTIVEDRGTTACCTPATSPAISPEDANRLAHVLKALADPTRLRLVSLIASHSGQACVCDLVDGVGLSQPTVSHHLKVLVEAGLLARERRGVWAYFSLVPGALTALTGHLGEHLTPR
jgi:ArsR family transcriptional regulator, arsenate/arsenite/antimonite-responsive transcriptional repressor